MDSSKKIHYKVHLSAVSADETFHTIEAAINFVEGYVIECLTDHSDGAGAANPGKITIEPVLS